MGKYLKLFENHTQYETYINGSGAILPNVSICTTEGDVHYNPWVETKLVVYYDIQDISSPTTVCTNYDGSFKSMEIDGNDSVDIATQGNITYQFDSAGEHIIKYELNGLGVGADAPLFYNLSTVKRVIIPNTFTSIGNVAFRNCSGLTSIDIPNSVTTIGVNAFYSCSSLTSIDIPSGVTSISNYAFYSCSSLTSIDIPSGVTSISNYAFSQCSGLTSIVIPNSVTSIGEAAFSNCSSLTSITVNAATPPTLGSSVFTWSNCPIYVPSESVEAYKSASGWSEYASRIQAIP
jgi:hypothetical protein